MGQRRSAAAAGDGGGFVDERVGSHGVTPTAPNLLKKPFKRLELAKRVRETLDHAKA